MDPRTVSVYEEHGRDWVAHRSAATPVDLEAFAAKAVPGPVLDLGCGPGWHAPQLGEAVVAVDAAHAMVAQVRAHAPRAWPVQADFEQLPFRPGTIGALFAHKSLHHVPADRLPLALAEAHRASALGAPLHIRVTSDRLAPGWPDAYPGRHFAYWSPERLRDVVEGAGFEVTALADDGKEWLDVDAVRGRLLPDTVGPGMRLLLVGLNPSLLSADTGIGFARPGNRFWPAAIAAGIATRPLDPYHLLRAHAVGMTNLVRRATTRADECHASEYREGRARLERLVAWLRPARVCFVGLTGYRVAVDRSAVAGWQPARLAAAPVYVMPNTSGLNAHTTPAGFAEHLRAAAFDAVP